MIGLKELLFRRHSKQVPEILSSKQPIEKQIIEPAQGEEKKRLEDDCTEYLQDPNKTTVGYFLTFIENMFRLMGEKKHETINGTVVAVSNPLKDQKNQTSIDFRFFTQNEVRGSTVAIRLGHPDKLGRLPVYHYFPPMELLPPSYTMPDNFCTTMLLINSHITNDESEMIVHERNMELNQDKAKDLARAVWNVYQRQEQPSELPTPQN